MRVGAFPTLALVPHVPGERQASASGIVRGCVRTLSVDISPIIAGLRGLLQITVRTVRGYSPLMRVCEGGTTEHIHAWRLGKMADGPDAPAALLRFRENKVRTIGGLPPDAPRTHVS